MPLQSEPFERESVLLLLYGATGRNDAVDLVLKQIAQRDIPPFWFFRRIEAVVLTMLERWDRVNEVLTAMDGRVESASPYLAALVLAIREEMIAAQGGPPPAHEMCATSDIWVGVSCSGTDHFARSAVNVAHAVRLTGVQEARRSAF